MVPTLNGENKVLIALSVVKKCQMIDFGEWADEENAIAGAPDMSDSDGWSEDQY